ncbi:hypothetical protein PGT21_026967 [Puccinia graminis f. sp. tritici]|uniref:Uncharacterized protein n=1 Tax=Puccinia graminis f. sp. tritici TaxID=56615 RepID=A0A5B0PUF4_PUCGR|nr:hypothetical protein PGTUg99_009880 [Puccinia graminis f. sp. tritici]KAA1104566.1 hypothetical protein PGT21_026967 [Puccinia graminis f. sp. tritici]
MVRMALSDLIQGDPNDPSSQFEGVRDDILPSHSLTPSPRSPSENLLEERDPNNMFAPLPNEDTTMADQTTVSTSFDSDLDKVCSDLQAKLKLDPENLEIALLTSKCTPAAQHANAIFAQAAFIQLALRPNSVTSAPHVFDDRFRASCITTSISDFAPAADFKLFNFRRTLFEPTLE